MTEATTIIGAAIILLFLTVIITYKYTKGLYQGDINAVKIQASQQIIQAADKARKDSVKTQRNTLKGQIVEKMAPLLKEFTSKYNPAEANFLGAPIDYII